MLNVYLRKSTKSGVKLGFTYILFQSKETKNDYQIHKTELDENIYLRECKRSLLINNFSCFVDRFKHYELNQVNKECLNACRGQLNYMVENMETKDLDYHLECVSNVRTHMLSLLKESSPSHVPYHVMMYYTLIKFVDEETEKYKTEQSKV